MDNRILLSSIAALAFLLIILVTVLPAGNGISEDIPGPDRAEPLNILAILPLTGDDAGIGKAQEYAIRKGTVQPSDRPLNLYVRDSRSDPDHAAALVEEQMNKHSIHGIIVSGTAATFAVAPITAESAIPVVSIAAPRQPDKNEGFSSLIWFTPPAEQEIAILEPFLSEYTDVTFLYPESEQGQARAALIQDHITALRLTVKAYDPDETDYTAFVRPLLAHPPEVYLIAGDDQVPALISALRSRGGNPVILVFEEGGLKLRAEAPHLAEGVFVLAPRTIQTHPVFMDEGYQALLMPAGTVAEAYDAAYTLSTRILSCEGMSGCILGWFWNRTYEGALGIIHFNEKREARYRYEISQIRFGEQEAVDEIRPPPSVVSIRIDTRGAPEWFADTVRRGVDPALFVLNTKTTIALPLAMQSGIPSLFDARVEATYDPIPDGDRNLIGTLTITPDGGGFVTGGGADPWIPIGVSEADYINRCFDLLDSVYTAAPGERGISLLFEEGDEKSREAVLEAAEVRGYRIVTNQTYRDAMTLRETVGIIAAESPDHPIFVSAKTPEDAVLFIMQSRESGYSPEAVFTIGDAWKSRAFLMRAGILADGIFAGSVYQREQLARHQVQRDVNTLVVRQTGGELNDISARAFTGIMLIADAANRAGDTDPAAVSAALRQAELTHAYGALYEGETVIVQLRGGVYRTVSTHTGISKSSIRPFSV